jgi:hypothetical protein
MQEVVIEQHRGNIPGHSSDLSLPKTRDKDSIAIGKPSTLSDFHQGFEVVKRGGVIFPVSFFIEGAKGVYPSDGAAFAGLLSIHSGPHV